eukprot:9041025-Alexandrium_andersonii.AAC.1
MPRRRPGGPPCDGAAGAPGGGRAFLVICLARHVQQGEQTSRWPLCLRRIDWQTPPATCPCNSRGEGECRRCGGPRGQGRRTPAQRCARFG